MVELTLEQKKAIALANARARAKKAADPTVARSEQEVMDEYNNMPWYGKAGTAADDLVRLGASGISFGALDRFLGPEEAKKTEEARIRAGWAGTGAEIGGAVASPITRAVGAIGSAASKVAPGLLARIGIAAGEGATLGAAESAIKGKDISDGATTGAMISAAVPIIGPVLGRTASFLQGTDPKAIPGAFAAGKEGGSVSKAFRQGQAGKQITDAKNEFAAAEAAWGNPKVDVHPLMREVGDIWGEITTGQGVPKLPAPDMRAFDRMMGIVNSALVRGDDLRTVDGIRRQLDEFAERGGTQAMMATRLKDVIRKSANAKQPNYAPSLDRYSKAKTAEVAGRELDTVFPKGSLLGHLAQTAVIGSGIAGVPIVGPGVLAALPAFSPKASGLIANMMGEIAGKTGVRAGAAAPVYSDYQDRRKQERNRRKRLRE